MFIRHSQVKLKKSKGKDVAKDKTVSPVGSLGEEYTTVRLLQSWWRKCVCSLHYSLNCERQLPILIMCLTIVNPKNIRCRKSLRKFKHVHLAFKHTYLNRSTLFKKKWKAWITITYCVVCLFICSKNKKQNQEGWKRREHKGLQLYLIHHISLFLE